MYLEWLASPSPRSAAVEVSGRPAFCLCKKRQGREERKLLSWSIYAMRSKLKLVTRKQGLSVNQELKPVFARDPDVLDDSVLD